MEKVQQKKYILYDIQAPVIKENVIISCPGVDGIKLKCKIKTGLAYKIRIPNWIYRKINQNHSFKLIKRILDRFKNIRYFYIPVVIKPKKETIILYKPYKTKWDTQRHWLSTNKWGKKNHPLTNLWLEVEKETITVQNLTIHITKREITDTLICKHLGQLKTFKLYN